MIKEKKTKAKGNNRKKPSLIQRKNEKRKTKRRNKKEIRKLMRIKNSLISPFTPASESGPHMVWGCAAELFQKRGHVRIFSDSQAG